MPQKSTIKQLFTFYFVVKDDDGKINFFCYPIAGNGKDVKIKKIAQNYTSFSANHLDLASQITNRQKWDGEITVDNSYQVRNYMEYQVSIACQPPNDPLKKQTPTDPSFKYTNFKRGYKPSLASYSEVLLKSVDVIDEKAISQFHPNTLDTFIGLLTDMYLNKNFNMNGVKGKLLSVFVRYSSENSEHTAIQPDLLTARNADPNSVKGKEFLKFIKEQDDFSAILAVDLSFSSWHIGDTLSLTDKTYPQRVFLRIYSKDVRDIVMAGGLRQKWYKEKKDQEKQNAKLKKLKQKLERERQAESFKIELEMQMDAVVNPDNYRTLADGSLTPATPPSPGAVKLK